MKSPMKSRVERDTICVLPWTSLFINNQGLVAPCCISTLPHESTSFKISKKNAASVIPAVWNADYMRDIRVKMLGGEKPAGCSCCYQKEAVSIRSFRQEENKRYRTLLAEVKKNADVKGSAPAKIRFFHFRLGSNCNLMCRMCAPDNSKGIFREYSEVLPERVAEYQQYEESTWCEDDHIWEAILQHSNDAIKIAFSGGEPLLDKKHFHFLKLLIDKDIASNIMLHYSTNLTTIPDEAFSCWPYFSEVALAGSIDGVGLVNDYIRYPSRWEHIQKTLHFIEENRKKLNITSCLIHSVVQAYNVMNLTELCEYVSAFDFVGPYPQFDFVIEEVPCLDARVLPEELKKIAIEKIQNYIKRSKPQFWKRAKRRAYHNLVNQLEGIITFLKKRTSPDGIHNFRHFTKTLDVARNQHLESSIPELASLL